MRVSRVRQTQQSCSKPQLSASIATINAITKTTTINTTTQSLTVSLALCYLLVLTGLPLRPLSTPDASGGILLVEGFFFDDGDVQEGHFCGEDLIEAVQMVCDKAGDSGVKIVQPTINTHRKRHLSPSLAALVVREPELADILMESQSRKHDESEYGAPKAELRQLQLLAQQAAVASASAQDADNEIADVGGSGEASDEDTNVDDGNEAALDALSEAAAALAARERASRRHRLQLSSLPISISQASSLDVQRLRSRRLGRHDKAQRQRRQAPTRPQLGASSINDDDNDGGDYSDDGVGAKSSEQFKPHKTKSSYKLEQQQQQQHYYYGNNKQNSTNNDIDSINRKQPKSLASSKSLTSSSASSSSSTSSYPLTTASLASGAKGSNQKNRRLKYRNNFSISRIRRTAPATTLARRKRQTIVVDGKITDACCVKQCDVETLKSYCPS